MSSPKNVDKRRVWWASEQARAEYLRLPPEIREMADFATTNLQNDREHETTKLKGKLKGIEETKCDHGGEAYRVFYMPNAADQLGILGALHKKSPKGKTMTKSWEDKLHKRRSALLKLWRERKGKK
jgi:phage-related protein